MEPLTEEHARQIDDALEGLRKGDEILKRAKSAGFDVDAQMKEATDAHKRLVGIKRAFFPVGG